MESEKMETNEITSDPSLSNSSEDPFVKPSLESPVFKKPVLIGKKIGKIKPLASSKENDINAPFVSNETEVTPKAEQKTEAVTKSNDSVKIPPNIPYSEPSWGGVPHAKFFVEELKSGQIVNTIDLSTRSFYCVGRERNTHLNLLHPTVSRYHAILQYKSTFDEKDPARGFYVYDLGSTHGTFLNRCKIKPKMYVRIHVGHMLSFGSSTRFFILQGPSEDEEEESELSVSELKEQRRQEKEKKEREALEKSLEQEAKTEEEDEGISWGMGDDAEEETDLSENPYASTNNEELYLDDPKKTLRGWFEREGEELTYDIDDKARPGGEFTCRVELPCESYIGRNLTAEISVKGKKKEVVIQCALEACRLLDRYGLLRQANHESKSKRRRKQQEDEDYDSDDDTFFDRTGTVEAKRSKRSGAVQSPAETYTSLLAKHADLVATIGSMEARLADMQARAAHKVMDSEAEDSLDAYMKSGYSEDTTEAKIERRRLKVEIASLKKQEETTRKLVNIAKPTSLPELKPPSFSSSTSSSSSSSAPSTTSSSPPSSSVSSSIKSHPKGRRRNEDKGSSGTTREDKSSSTTCQEKSSTTSDDRMECDKEKEEEEEEEEEEGVCKAEDVESKTNKDSTNKRSSHTGVKSSSSKPPPVSTLDFIQRNSIKQSPNHSTKSKPISEPISSMNDEEFSTTCWQPPKNQTGDGRTALNDKYGY